MDQIELTMVVDSRGRSWLLIITKWLTVTEQTTDHNSEKLKVVCQCPEGDSVQSTGCYCVCFTGMDLCVACPQMHWEISMFLAPRVLWLIRFHWEVVCQKTELAHSRFSSFQITTECNEVAEMYDPQLWPVWSFVQRFYETHQLRGATVSVSLSQEGNSS